MEENPDLFWGVRGGGGNFGVVTMFEFRLHPMERQVFGGGIAFPLSQARQVLEFYADYSADAPDELYIDAGLASRPGLGDSVWMSVCWCGPKKDAERWIAPIRKAGTPLVDQLGPIDYVALQRSTDMTDPRARGIYVKSGFVPGIPQALLDSIVDGFEPHPERAFTVAFAHIGGAVGRVAPDAMAFPHRYARNDLLALMDWPVGIDASRHIEWLRSYWQALSPHTRGFYTNDNSVQSQAEIDENYMDNYPRLVQLKNRYDPTNLFRLNTNVRPAA